MPEPKGAASKRAVLKELANGYASPRRKGITMRHFDYDDFED